jgi:hypothetical protein
LTGFHVLNGRRRQIAPNTILLDKFDHHALGFRKFRQQAAQFSRGRLAVEGALGRLKALVHFLPQRDELVVARGLLALGQACLRARLGHADQNQRKGAEDSVADRHDILPSPKVFQSPSSPNNPSNPARRRRPNASNFKYTSTFRLAGR